MGESISKIVRSLDACKQQIRAVFVSFSFLAQCPLPNMGTKDLRTSFVVFCVGVRLLDAPGQLLPLCRPLASAIRYAESL